MTEHSTEEARHGRKCNACRNNHSVPGGVCTACGSDELAKVDARADAAERQVSEVRRVITALRETDDPTSEYRRMLADWLDAALAGDLDPEDVRSRFRPAAPSEEGE